MSIKSQADFRMKNVCDFQIADHGYSGEVIEGFDVFSVLLRDIYSECKNHIKVVFKRYLCGSAPQSKKSHKRFIFSGFDKKSIAFDVWIIQLNPCLAKNKEFIVSKRIIRSDASKKRRLAGIFADTYALTGKTATAREPSKSAIHGRSVY